MLFSFHATRQAKIYSTVRRRYAILFRPVNCLYGLKSSQTSLLLGDEVFYVSSRGQHEFQAKAMVVVFAALCSSCFLLLNSQQCLRHTQEFVVRKWHLRMPVKLKQLEIVWFCRHTRIYDSLCPCVYSDSRLPLFFSLIHSFRHASCFRKRSVVINFTVSPYQCSSKQL